MSLQWALFWASRGFPVFPCHAGRKTPAIDGFQVEATCDSVKIRQWWLSPTGVELPYNIGAVPRGKVLVDLDVKEGRNGLIDFHNLGLAMDTLVCRTPTGGCHLWYYGPPTANSVKRIAEGIDSRGPQGYAVMPGSITADGEYTILHDLPIKVIPPIILTRLKAHVERLSDQTPFIELDSPSALAFANSFLANAAPAIEGCGGNHHTFVIASELRDIGLSQEAALLAMLENWNARCVPPWDSDELEALVANAYTYAQNAPGRKHPSTDFAGARFDPIEPPASLLPVENPFMRFGNLIPLGNLKPRSWVLKKLLLRGEITTLIAAGGVGKSQLALSMAIALALGENLFGFENATPSVPQHSIIYNAEDSLEEMSMRLHATCNALNLDPEKISPYIVLVSAKDLRPGKFKLLSVNEHGQVVVTDDTKKIINWLIEACHKYKPALVCFDPLGKLHEVNESDNIVIGRLMENMTTILAECNAAGLLCHHESKPSTYGPAATAAAMSRGAVEIVNGSRAAFRLSSPTDADANRWNMSDQIRRRLVRLDDAKNNRTLGGEPTTWIEKASIKLPSGEDVGAFVPPKVLEGADEGRQQMARVLIAEITAAGKGAVPLAEAASMLQRADPLYAQLTPKQVQVRVEAVIGSGVEADGGRVSVQSDGRSRRVQLG